MFKMPCRDERGGRSRKSNENDGHGHGASENDNGSPVRVRVFPDRTTVLIRLVHL